MKIKNIMIGMIAVFLVLLAAFAIQQALEPGITEPEYFTSDAATWIEDIETTEDADDISINLFRATSGNAAFVDYMQEDYVIDGETTSFFYRGGYEGTPFRTAYFAEDFYTAVQGKTAEEQEGLARKYILMKIGPELDPTDSVIDGFILGKLENNKFVFYIFVDQDWVQKLEYTNILWGDDFTDPSTLHMRSFDFSRPVNGVYIDKLSEDVDWFEQNPVAGGIAVGEIDKNILQKIIDQEYANSTFMYVR